MRLIFPTPAVEIPVADVVKGDAYTVPTAELLLCTVRFSGAVLLVGVVRAVGCAVAPPQLREAQVVPFAPELLERARALLLDAGDLI